MNMNYRKQVTSCLWAQLCSWLLSGMPLDNVGPVWQMFEAVLLTEIFKLLIFFKPRKPKGKYYPI